MKTQLAFCSACDRDVQIVITDAPSQDGQANLHDAEVVCLEIGEGCTGHLCPIGAAPPTVMAARLVQNGLQTVLRPMIQAECTRCGGSTMHVVIDRQYATCSECGATSERPSAPAP